MKSWKVTYFWCMYLPSNLLLSREGYVRITTSSSTRTVRASARAALFCRTCELHPAPDGGTVRLEPYPGGTVKLDPAPGGTVKLEPAPGGTVKLEPAPAGGTVKLEPARAPPAAPAGGPQYSAHSAHIQCIHTSCAFTPAAPARGRSRRAPRHTCHGR